MFKNIVFWLEYPLFHISPLIRSVSEQRGLKVIVICEKDIPRWRLDMGFTLPDFGNAEVYVQPGSKLRKKIENDYSNEETVHIFHGLRGVKENYKSFKILTKSPCSLGLYFEPSVFQGTPKAILRKYIYKRLFFKIKRHIDVMFALGNLGQSQYIQLGLPDNKVHSFPYFIDDCNIINSSNVEEKLTHNDIIITPSIKLLYIGQLIPRKNISLLIRSVKKLVASGQKVTLTIVGNGLLKNHLKNLVKQLNLEGSVYFLGKKSQTELKNIYQNHDIFILPSKFDGWGAVSVEAMANGLPVVISNTCGSYSIIKDNSHGLVFKSGSLHSLTNKLEWLIKNIKLYQTEEALSNRVEYVRKNLSSSAGQRLLIEALEDIVK